VYMSRAAVNWQIELGNTASQICDSSTDGYLARGDCDPTGSYSRGYFYGKSASTNYWDAVVS